MFSPEQFLDLSRTEHRVIFENVEEIWQALPKIAAYLQFRLKPGMYGRALGNPFLGSAVFVGKGSLVEQGAMIKGPAWIGEDCQIRSGCYIRENVIIGNGVVAGNSCEFKNCLVFDEAQVPHFNYVGDSLLGYKVHLGAGVILSNVKLDHTSDQCGGSRGKRLPDRLAKVRGRCRRLRGNRLPQRFVSRFHHRATMHCLSRSAVARRSWREPDREASARGRVCCPEALAGFPGRAPTAEHFRSATFLLCPLLFLWNGCRVTVFAYEVAV